MDENINNTKTKWRKKLFREEEEEDPILKKKENNFDIEYIEQKLKTIKNRKKYKSLDPEIAPLENIYEPFVEGLKMKKLKIKKITNTKNISKNVKKISEVKKISKIKKLPKIKTKSKTRKKKSNLQSGVSKTMISIKNAINKLKYILFYIPNNLNKLIYDGTYQYANVMTKLDSDSKQQPVSTQPPIPTTLPSKTKIPEVNNPTISPAQQKIKDDTNILVQLIYIIFLLFVSIFVSYNLYDVTFNPTKTYPIQFDIFNQTNVTSYIYTVLQFFLKFCIYPTHVIDMYLLKENSLQTFFEKMEFKIIAFFILFLFSFLFLIMVFVPNLNTKLNYVTYFAFGGLILYQYIKFVVEGIDIMGTTDTKTDTTESPNIPNDISNETQNIPNEPKNPESDIGLNDILTEGLNIDPKKIFEDLNKQTPTEKSIFIKNELTKLQNNPALNQIKQQVSSELSILAIKSTSPALYYTIFGIYSVLVAVIAFISIKISVSVFTLYLLIYCFFGMGLYGEHFMSIFNLWKDKRNDIDKMFKGEYDNLIKKDKKDMTTIEQIAEFLYNHRYKFTFILVSIFGAIRSGVSLHSNVLKCINVLVFALIIVGNLYIIIHSYGETAVKPLQAGGSFRGEPISSSISNIAQNWVNQISQTI